MAKKLKKIIEEFGLQDKFIVFMNDRGSNCLLAVKILLRQLGINGLSLTCLTHGLHNLINKDLLGENKDKQLSKQMSDLLTKIRTIKKKLAYKNQQIAEKSKFFRTIEKLKLMAEFDEQDFEDAVKVRFENKFFVDF